ncbi:MAG TPA: carbamoyltransferase N-terminal domain-containing protein, partial [Planctomycetia bacterium]|nr:carbamoyltransferase N-terminal domain-containing protein [Planctomycetia bacterium]
RFPEHAARYCLAAAGLSIGDVDFVAFYDKPIAKFERMLETYLAYAPRGYSSFRTALPTWLKQKLFLPREMDRGLGGRFRRGRGKYVFIEHHESHAASAFFPSPYDEAAILTLDGVGEWSTSCMGAGRGERIELTREIRFPHSLGLLYSAFTHYLGFKVNSGEYKVMGLAPYGEPRYKDRILEKLVDLKDDGSFRLDMSCFAYAAGLAMTSPRFDALFEGPARKPESLLTQREMDLAASLQAATEEIVLRCARELRRSTGMKNLVLAGGVALNCVANGKILREGIFDDLWIQPAAGDAGGALGAAWMTWHQLLGNPRSPAGRDAQSGSLLGPEFPDDEIVAFLESQGAECETAADDDELCRMTAAMLADGKIVGWFQGRMEFGPRALGARSILGDARSPRMQSAMNLKIKFRESFRPFAPIVLRERVHEWFETPPELDSPYMLLVAPVREEHRVAPPPGYEKSWGIEKLNHARSAVPAITHVDHSARLQTVDAERNPLLHRLLKRFEAETGCPMLVNTSFNVRSEPIVCTPADAYRCFLATEIDVLALGRRVLRKDRMKVAKLDDAAREAHLAQFKPD